MVDFIYLTYIKKNYFKNEKIIFYIENRVYIKKQYNRKVTNRYS